MTKSQLPLLASFAACIVLGGCQTAETKPDRFGQADTNHDGKLSLAEANAYLVGKVFDARDLNHDGKITKAEWGFEGDKSAQREFRVRDANHDGVVTKAEAIEYGLKHGVAKKAMKEADTNKDGYVTREEVKAYYAKHEGLQ